MRIFVRFPYIATMRSTSWIIAMSLLALVLPRSDAQSVYTYTGNTLFKCVSRSGAVSIQQQPCAAKTKTVWYREVVPEAPPSYAEQVRRGRESQKRAQDARDLSHMTGTDQQSAYAPTYRVLDQRDQQRAQCRQARAYRDAALKQFGLSHTYQQQQNMDAAVYEACHGLDM